MWDVGVPSPTPRVDWERLIKPMSPRARTDSYGQELIIENVQFEDAGTYQCGGINTETSSAVRRSFNVDVQCRCHGRIYYLTL